MEITIIYDNTAVDPFLVPAWGFSCLIRHEGFTLLFDTGAEGALLLSNMEKLGIDPESVDKVVLSHPHFDHVGGLESFLSQNSRAEVYFPDTGVPNMHSRATPIRESQELASGIHTTGVLSFIEQSVIVEISNGIALISGCAHPGLKNILDAASNYGKVKAIIGGLHDFTDFHLLRDMELICPTHCTFYLNQLQEMFPETCLQGGAGRKVHLE